MSNKKQRLKNSKGSLLKVLLFFLGLFAILIANNVRFLLFESSNLIINPYNSRMSEIEEGINRGTIYDKNMVPLAQSIESNDENVRVYPYANLFSHIVGYSTRGKTGIENLYNIELLQNDDNIFESIFNDIRGTNSQGNSVVTTLDLNLQKEAYNLLGDHRGAIVAMDPTTGKILCMVSKPDFDPNYINDNWDELAENEDSPFYNRATQGLYPPGSTFKILTAIEYLLEFDESQFYYNCTGEDVFGEREIICYNHTAHGELNLMEAFAVSCNTSFSKMGEEVDTNSLNELANQLLFNQALPIDLSYSTSRFTLNSNSEQSLIVETAMGQGETLISPLHSLLITSTIANGGVLMEPYVVDSVINNDNEVIQKNLPTMYNQLLETEITSKIKDYMVEVVENGTGKGSNIEGLSIAAKTGTAENSSGADHAWYVGFAPADNPTIAIAIIVENSGTSTEYSVPIAKKMFELYFDE